MAIRFDHIQLLKNSYWVLSGAAKEIVSVSPAATLTDYELYRGYVNPGFDGTLEFLEAHFLFAISASGSTTFSGKWQMRSRGETTWTDISTVAARTINTPVSAIENLIHYDAVAATNTSPAEVRLIVTTSASVTLCATFANDDDVTGCPQSGDRAAATSTQDCRTTVRIVGESV